MTNAQIVALGVRLFAVWLGFYVLQQIPQMWVFANRGTADAFILMLAVVTYLVLIALTVVLWKFPLAVARKLLPVATLDQPTPLPVEQLEHAGFCLLGLWILAETVPSLVHAAVMFSYSRGLNPSVELNASYYAHLAYSGAGLAIGVWLLFGARGLLGVLRWARTAGTADKGAAP